MTSGPTDSLGVTVDVEGDFAGFDADLLKAISQSTTEIAQLVQKLAKKMEASLKQASKGFDNRSVDAGTASVKKLASSLEAIENLTKGFPKAFGDGFDPGPIEGMGDQLKQLVSLQSEVAAGLGVLDESDLKNLLGQIRLVTAGVVATREATLAAARATDESNRNVARDARQVSREVVEASRAARSRYVVDQQAQASAARDAANKAIEATRASSRRRVALIQGAARTIATIERGLSGVFRTTGNVASSAFTAIGRAASRSSSVIRQTFTRSSNDVNNSTSRISNSYASSFKSATRSVRNETREQSSVINNFAREASASIGGIGLGGLAVGGILGLGVGKALSSGFNRAANLQDAERALTFLLGSQEKAAELQAEILDIVQGTPFALDQFATATTQLLSFGIEAEKIPGLLRAVGDVAILSSSQTQTIDSLVRVFGQISAAGKLTGEDLNQLSEASVPALRILGNALGKTTGEVRDLVSEGLIPAEQALQILQDGILEGSDGVNGATAAFGGLSKELGTGLRGSLANFNTAIARAGAGFFKAFEKPFTQTLAAATAGVDLLGKAVQTLATSIASSGAFSLITKGLKGATSAFASAKDALIPLFEFLAEGAVLFGQVTLGLFTFKRIPAILSAIARAVRLVLSPTNLLIAAGIVVSSFVKRLYDDSEDLRDALSRLGSLIRRLARIIQVVAVEAFQAFIGSADGVGKSAEGFADKVLGVAVPALESLNRFLENKVLPAFRRFVVFARNEIIPVVGRALGNAIKFGQDAFRFLVDFIQDEVIPVVGPILSRAVDIGFNAFRSAHRFLSETFLPFVQNNLTPVLTGLGAALGVLVFSGGNIPLAGLAGISAGIASALSDGKIREALVDVFKGAVSAVQVILSNLINATTISNIAVGALKIARKLGETIGSFLSDHRVVGLVAAITAFALSVAGAFALGFIEGVAKNIPKLVSELSKLLKTGLREAMKAIISDPTLVLLLAGIFATGALIAKVRASGRKIGQTFATAAAEGLTPASTGSGGFVRAFFGGSAAIKADFQKNLRELEPLVISESRRLNAISRRVSNANLRGPATDPSRPNLTGPFLKLSDAKGISKSFDDLILKYGKATVAGAAFREGVDKIGTGIRNFGRGGLTDLKTGIRNIGTSLQLVGKQVFSVAGAVAGGAYAASFLAQAFFDPGASTSDKVSAGLGLAASALTTGLVVSSIATPAVGAAAAGATLLVGGLTAAFKGSEEAAKRAAAQVQRYADAVLNAGQAGADAAPGIQAVFEQAIRDAPTKLVELLDRIGFDYKKFSDQVTNGKETEALAELEKAARGAGLSFTEMGAVGGFVTSQARAITDGFDEAATRARVLGIDGSRSLGYINEGLERWRANQEKIAEASGAADVATEAFRQTVETLNQERIDQLTTQVGNARTKFDEARTAAEGALTAAINFLTGQTEESSFEKTINAGVLSVESLTSSIEALDEAEGRGATALTAATETALANIKEEAGRVLSSIRLPDGEILSKEQANLALAPLKFAAAEVGGEAGTAAIAAIDEVLANFDTKEGKNLLADALDLKGQLSLAQAQLDEAENVLNFRLGIDPLTLAPIVEQAKTAFTEAGAAATEGFVAGLDSEQMKTAAREVAEEAILAALTALDANSPSGEFKKLGEFSVDGFVLGIDGSMSTVTRAARGIALAATSATRTAINQELASMVALGESLMDAVARGIQNSVSKVTAATTSVLNRASTAANTSTASVNAVLSSPTGTAGQPLERSSIEVNQTFNEKIDPRAAASAMVWRLTG